jgi:hypothetical protein
MAKRIDELKKKLLCNPKIKMMAFNFPQGTSNMSSLSSILEEHPDPKYFLSKKQQEQLTRDLNRKIPRSRLHFVHDTETAPEATSNN